LLSALDGQPATYQAWAGDHYGRPIPLSAVRRVYEHRQLTDKLVALLNPRRSLKKLKSDIKEIGYRDGESRQSRHCT